MFKKLDWKAVLSFLAQAAVLLFGGAGAGYYAAELREEPASSYETAPPAPEWESRYNYRLTAVWHKEAPVKAGNFTDAKVEKDGLGLHTVYAAAPSDAAAISAYESLTGYSKVGITKKMKWEARPGLKIPEESNDILETTEE